MTEGDKDTPALDQMTSAASSPGEVRERHESNRRAWNEGAAYYAERIPDTIEFIRSRRSNLHPLERPMLGDLRTWCGRAIHLQCAGGRDTLSLWVEGAAEVVGIDISDRMIENARRASEALGAPARWFRCDVLDAPAELDGTADLVYTGRGALIWIHDLAAWAQVVARLLRPGGVLTILDEHPSIWFFDPTSSELRLERQLNYFGAAWESQGWSPEYIGELDRPANQLAVKYEGLWNFADIFGALTRAGLVVDHLGEHPETYYDSFPNLSDADRRRIPHTFTLRAHKPANPSAA